MSATAKNLATLALAATMILPALLAVSPAASADNVPTVPGGSAPVAWTPLTGFTQTFWLTYGNLPTGTTDCTNAGGMSPTPPSTDTTSPQPQCPYGTGGIGGTLPNTATFQYPSGFTREWNATGQSMTLHLRGSFQTSQNFTVTVAAGTQTRMEGWHTTTSNPDPTAPGSDLRGFDVPLYPYQGALRANFPAQSQFIITITSAAANLGNTVPLSATQWSLNGATTSITISSDDAYRAATWTGDANATVINTFRPAANNTTVAPLKGFFAVQSAWGYGDIAGAGAPTFRVFQGDLPFQPFPTADTRADSQIVSSLSSTDAGIVTWGFKGDAMDYRGWPVSQLHLRADMRYHDQNSLTPGNDHVFAINSRGVSLAPFADANLTPRVVEDVAHTAPGGGTTTFLLSATNVGSAADSFRVTSTFVPVPGSPQTGWSATLGGPQVVGDTVSLAPGESKIVTLTVGLPFADSGSGTFQVRAASVNDSQLASDPLTLIARIGAPSGHDVVVIAPQDATVDPGRDTDIPVYVWNRGGTLANATLSIPSTDAGGWTTSLAANGQTLRSVQVANVPPGALSAASLRVHGPDQSQAPQLIAKLNVTNNDVAGYAMDRLVTLRLTQVGGLRVEVFDTINGQPVSAEIDQCARPGNTPTAPGTAPDIPLSPSSAGCTSPNGLPPADGVDGLLLRTWITNTGRTTEDVNVTIDPSTVGRSTNSGSNCPENALANGITPNQDGFRLMTRGANGFTAFDGTLKQVQPGQTYELYILLSVNREASICNDRDLGYDFLRFVVHATGVKTGVIAGYTTEVRATDSSQVQGIGDADGAFVQAVVRQASATNPTVPLVDTTHEPDRVITQGVSVGKNATFYVRLTNGAAWGSYNDTNSHFVAAWANLTIVNPKQADGWNVSVRPVVAGANEQQNPFNASYALSNDDPTTNGIGNLGARRLAMNDVELQVNVTAPNGVTHTALAGDQDQITLEATQGTARSTLSLITVVGDQAVVNLHAAPRVLAHPVDGGATTVYVYNNGSAPTTVTLSAAVDRDATPNPDGWSVQPAAQTFTLPAFHNRTVALAITPPTGGTSGRIQVSASYVEFRASGQVNVTSVQIPVDVVPAGALSLNAPSRAVTVAPGQPAQFTLSVGNAGNAPITYRLSATDVPNWTETLSPSQGSVGGGQSVSVPFVLQAPSDALNATAYQAVVTVQNADQPEDFATLPVTVSIQGGAAIPALSAPVLQKTVDRASSQSFDVQVRNLGNANGTLPLAVRTAEPGWSALIQDAKGKNITSVTLGPNELTTVSVIVFSPLLVPENKGVSFEVTTTTQDATQSSNLVLRALIHDYGVKASIPVGSFDLIPGIAQEYVVHVTNTGNDNDTLNMSTILPETDFKDWTSAIAPDHVLLAPGESTDVHATLRSPVSPLPSPRAYAFTFYVGSVGGAAVNVPKNATVAASANVLNYRALDVDGDGQVELAIDQDKSSANGFEQFREVSGDGVQCVVASNSRLSGTARFFLDCPIDGKSLDGIADVWFDPDSVYAYKIATVADVNGDGTPDYLLDTDRDGKIDTTFDTVTEKYWATTQVHALGGDAVQYLVDTNADGRPDYYVDAAAKVATKTLPVAGHDDLVGLDTKNTGAADKYYDPATQSVTGASVANLNEFAVTNWYFIAGFVALVILTVVLIVVRARGRKKQP